METLKSPVETRANKEHRCNFCGEKIAKKGLYLKSTHVYDGDLYDWRAHKHCAEIASKLNMYNNCDEGVTDEYFQEAIHSEYFDLLVSKFSKEDVTKYSDIIQQLRYVKFRDKLGYVIRHYNKIDKNG